MNYKVIPVTAYQQNCSLIWCEKTNAAALVDPGGDVDLLQAQIETVGCRLEKILLTHGHIDHVGGAAQIAALTGVPIIGPHQADAFWLEQLPRQAEMFTFTHADAFVPDQWLEHGASVEVGDERLNVLHCPGHTPGHVVFYNASAGLVFVGDVLFQGSVGRTDFPGGDLDTLMKSIHEQLLVLDDDVVVVPGHGSLTTIGQERASNPFLQQGKS